MAGTSQSGKDAENPSAIDLSELQDLNFGPDWTSGKSITTHTRSSRDRGGRDRAPGSRSGGPGRRDRRPSRPPREGGPGKEKRGGDRRRDRRDHREEAPQEEYQPVVDVLFYPEDIPFKALCHAIKTSCRTYELFELARLILSKPERYVSVMKPLSGVPGQLERFIVAVPDGLPFESEEAAMAHVMDKHLDRFFTTEEVEIDPPKGSFQMVNRCGVTGELLGPPNYHRYQTLLSEHHARCVPNMSFERFQQKIEAVKEQEVIDEWLKKMSHVLRYKVISPREGEPEYLDGPEAAKHFLLAKRRSEVVRESEQVRLSGKNVEQLPDGSIARSIHAVRERQLRFPLDTANNLRGRLRRMNFTIYKRGAKGVSYVCAVKRSFRDENTNFSESLQALIDFIEKNQNISVSVLPKAFLGVSLDKGAEQPPPPEKAPAIEKVSEAEASKIVEAHEKNRLAEQEEETPVTEPAPEAQAESPAAEQKPLTDEEKQVHQLFADLRWLVTEGYVTEFGDGKLFANPVIATQAPKAEAPATKAEDKPAPKAPSDPSPAAPEAKAPEVEIPAPTESDKPAEAAPAEKKPEPAPESSQEDPVAAAAEKPEAPATEQAADTPAQEEAPKKADESKA